MKWALVLSGGGARGLAYIGMLKAFKELKYPQPDYIVGCSMGAIIGGLYASGMTIEEMEDFFSKDFDPGDYIDVFKHNFKSQWMSKVLKIGTGLSNLLHKKGIDSGENTHRLFKKLFCYQKFENLNIPFACNATELCSGEEYVFESGFLSDAVRASSSYPICFAPFELDNKVFVDGCVKNNTPIWIAKRKGYKNILAVTLGTFQKKTKAEFESIASVILRSLDVAASTIDPKKDSIPTHILDLDSKTPSYDFSLPENQLKFGYEITMSNKDILDKFFKSGIAGYINRFKLKRKTKELLKNERIF